jgi:hypothetical protein
MKTGNMNRNKLETTRKGTPKKKRLSGFFFCETLLVLSITGCVSQNVYPPTVPLAVANSVTVDEAKSDLWKRLVPSLGQHFFVVNNMDRESGFINVSYSGDPIKYVDCGHLKVNDKEFPGAQAYTQYNLFLVVENFKVLRRMTLEGRANIVLEELEPKKTKVSAHTRYVITRSVTATNSRGQSRAESSTVAFNTGTDGTFEGEYAVTCRATGLFEADILKLVQSPSLPKQSESC